MRERTAVSRNSTAVWRFNRAQQSLSVPLVVERRSALGALVVSDRDLHVAGRAVVAVAGWIAHAAATFTSPKIVAASGPGREGPGVAATSGSDCCDSLPPGSHNSWASAREPTVHVTWSQK